MKILDFLSATVLDIDDWESGVRDRTILGGRKSKKSENNCLNKGYRFFFS
jgi:hypothetical protein